MRQMHHMDWKLSQALWISHQEKAKKTQGLVCSVELKHLLRVELCLLQEQMRTQGTVQETGHGHYFAGSMDQRKPYSLTHTMIMGGGGTVPAFPRTSKTGHLRSKLIYIFMTRISCFPAATTTLETVYNKIHTNYYSNERIEVVVLLGL